MSAIVSPVLPDLRLALAPHIDSFLALVEVASGDSGNMGDIEDLCSDELREVQRLAVERVCQQKADGIGDLYCPVCGEKLESITHDHERTAKTRFGDIKLRRSRGFCRRCVSNGVFQPTTCWV